MREENPLSQFPITNYESSEGTATETPTLCVRKKSAASLCPHRLKKDICAFHFFFILIAYHSKLIENHGETGRKRFIENKICFYEYFCIESENCASNDIKRMI